MRKLERRMLSFIMVIALVFTTCLPIYAETAIDPITQVIVDQLESMLPQYAASENIPLDTVELGTPLSTYRVANSGLIPLDYTVYPVISNQHIIALADVLGETANTTQTTLYVDFAVALEEYVSTHDSPFAIIYAKEGVFALSSDKVLTMLKDGLTNITSELYDIDLETINVSYAEISTICQLTLGPIPRVRLGVKHVPNDTSTHCCGDGLCWASSIAMIANYYEGTSYDALDIHHDYGCLGGFAYNHLRPYCYIDALTLLGMADYTLSYSYLTYPILYNFLSDDQLLFTHLYTVDPEATENHVIVGCGYQYNTTTAKFLFMDPNTGKGSASFPLTTGPLIFTLGGVTFEVDYYIATEWS